MVSSGTVLHVAERRFIFFHSTTSFLFGAAPLDLYCTVPPPATELVQRSSQSAVIFGLSVVVASEFVKAVDTAVEPRRISPLAFTDNCVYAAPSRLKEKPIFVTADAVSSTLPPASSAVAPV